MSVLRRKKAERVRKKKWRRWLMKGLLWRNYTLSSRWLVWEDEAQGREGNRKEPRNYLRKSQNMNIFQKLNPTFKREWLPTDIAMTFPSLLMTQDILPTWLLDQKLCFMKIILNLDSGNWIKVTFLSLKMWPWVNQLLHCSESCHSNGGALL